MTDTTPPITDTSPPLFLATYAARVAGGISTAADDAEVSAWVAANEARKAHVASLIEVARLARRIPAPFNAKAAWDTAAGRLGIQGQEAVELPANVLRPSPVQLIHALPASGRWWARFQVAAMTVAVLVGCIAISYWSMHPRAAGRAYATAPGQQMSVALVDGTHVTLGPETRLRLSADYATGVRTVELDGEAYFTVVHDTRHPFVVHAGETVTRDVGTAFDIRAYHDDPATQVAVVEGAVLANTQPLRAGDVAEIGARGGITVRHPNDILRYTDWMQGTLVFEEVPLRDVARDVSRAFGVPITVADSTLLEKRITGTLSNRPLDFILDVVTQAVGARYERTTHGVIIRSRTASDSARQGPRPVSLTTVQTANQTHP